jgi:hypothetical protein
LGKYLVDRAATAIAFLKILLNQNITADPPSQNGETVANFRSVEPIQS